VVSLSSGGLVIAAPASGSGKTTITLGLLRHLARKGVRVASAKAGPDYIDPAFHAAASGRACLNLDPWAMRRDTVAALLADLTQDAEIVLCEGVMGLFDGAGPDAVGSTADLAALLGWPVVLVIDIARQGASASAVLRGFAAHRPDVPIVGVILNRAAGASHAALASMAIARATPEIAVLGWMKRDAALAVPERHLGLVQAGEHPALAGFLDTAADAVAAQIDIAALLALARPSTLARASDAGAPVPPLGQRIAVARDDAFSFAYPATLAGWRRAGAAVSFFSPLDDAAPTPDCDAIYLPGGYPELHGGRLAANARFMSGLRQAAARDAVIYGECGGYMTLGRVMVDADGARHAMAGLLPLQSSFAARKLHLGYRRATLLAASPIGDAGAALRGHEFHYASVIDEGPGDALFAVGDAAGQGRGQVGRRHGRVMGSFLHVIDRESPAESP
jgi:cobyrinic acid a,c-diamide synthase